MINITCCCVSAFLLMAMIFPGKVNAKPLWELGAGFGVYNYPHYLGANQSTTYALPVPYLIYRGEHLRSDRSGLTGLLYDDDHWHLRLSLGGSLPVNSEDNEARVGMPDRDFVFELGPSIQYDFIDDGEERLYLDWAVRSAYGVGDSSGHHGYTMIPRLAYKNMFDGWRISNSAGVVFSSKDYHDFTYSVEPRYATEDRETYKARSGYTGFRFSVAANKRIGNLVIAVYSSYYNLRRAANIESPLMKVDSYTTGGLALIWILGQSDENVSYDDL